MSMYYNEQAVPDVRQTDIFHTPGILKWAEHNGHKDQAVKQVTGAVYWQSETDNTIDQTQDSSMTVHMSVSLFQTPAVDNGNVCDILKNT